MSDARRGGRIRQVAAVVVGLALGASGMALAQANRAVAVPQHDQGAMEQMFRNYLLEHPEVIPEAMAKLEERRAAEKVSASRQAIETPFAGAWAGAAKPEVTLVEFFDYNCGYCRASVPDLDRLLKEDPSLRIVFRELPILSEQSEVAARVSLSAAKQGRFMDFHRNMFAGGRPTEAQLTTVRKSSGLDAAAVERDLKAPDVEREIAANMEMARTLGLSGTPSFVVGERVLVGAVGYDELKKAIAEARAAKAG